MNDMAKPDDRGDFKVSEYVGRDHGLDRKGAEVEPMPPAVIKCPHCKKEIEIPQPEMAGEE